MAGDSSGRFGWIKAGVTSLFGLMGGAALMYISPLVNNVIKPPKPVPNFAQQAQGLAVTFLDHSTGGGDGWWDFGDGSALEPYNAKQESIIHTFPRPGSYTVKLSLRNFLGDERERTVSVNVDGPSGPPVIEDFRILPVGPEVAPATYRIVSKVKNADLTLCYLGDNRPLEINTESAAQERVVTLKEPGSYKLRLVAVSGKQTVEKAEDVWVGVGDFSAPTATLQVTYSAVLTEKVQKEMNVSATFPADHKDHAFAFKLERAADSGFQIADVKFKDGARSAKLDVSGDKTKFIVTGELNKPSGFWNKNAPPPSFHATVLVNMERRSQAQTHCVDPVMVSLTVPGSVKLPLPTLPSCWSAKSRDLELKIRDNGKVILTESRFPFVSTVTMRGRTCRITANEKNGQILLEVIDVTKVAGGIGN